MNREWMYTCWQSKWVYKLCTHSKLTFCENNNTNSRKMIRSYTHHNAVLREISNMTSFRTTELLSIKIAFTGCKSRSESLSCASSGRFSGNWFSRHTCSLFLVIFNQPAKRKPCFKNIGFLLFLKIKMVVLPLLQITFVL